MKSILLFTLMVTCLLYSDIAVRADKLTDLVTGNATASESTVTDKVISIDSSSKTDAGIKKRLQSILAELEDLKDLTVNVSNGVVTLQGEVVSPTSEKRVLQIAGQIEGVVGVENRLTINRSVEKRMNTTLQKLIRIGTETMSALPLLLLAIIALSLFWVFGKWVSMRHSLFRRIAPNTFIASLLGQIAHTIIILLGLVVALSLLDATSLIGTVLGAAGIVGLAVGFAVKDTVENYIASILLSVRNPFEVKDFVDIDGNQGSVVRLTSRATILISPDGDHLRIPNSIVFKAVITNYTRNPERRFKFNIGMDSKQDFLQAQAVVLKILGGIEGVLNDPEPMVVIDEPGDSKIVISVYGWVDQANFSFIKVRSEAIRQIKQAFEKADSGKTQAKPAGGPPKRIAGIETSTVPDLRPDKTVENKIAEEQGHPDAENLLSAASPNE